VDTEGAVNESFEEIRKIIPGVTDPVLDPEQTVRDIHRAWKDAGGTVSGKPRHSDRFLDDRLKASKTAVRSLTPKLVGKTRIKSDDAEKLLRFLLMNWPRPVPGETSEAKNVRYEALLSKDEINEIVGFVAEQIESAPGSRFEEEQIEAAPRDEEFRPLPGRDLGELIPAMFKDSDAYFIVATERANVEQPQKTALIGFRNLMDSLQSVEDEDGKERPLVWVLDIGRRTFEDLEARLRYIAFKNLQMRFKALEEFEDRMREPRWKWLLARAAFVVQDTRFEETIDMKGVKRPLFLAHHVSFTAIAPAWASSPNFRTLYGRELENLDQRSFSVFYNASGWPYDGEFVTEEPQHCRYFGYATFARDQRPNAERVPRGLELPFMGVNYEDAYRTLYAAATDLLELRSGLKSRPEFSGKQAMAQLRFLGFRLLRLDEFMKL
jgi:hypothetical protein